MKLRVPHLWKASGLLVLAVLAFSSPSPSSAQGNYSVKDNYAKSEYQLVMRDGIKLFTSVYVPRDASQKYPIIMQRTPYSVAPYGPENYRPQLGPSPLFAKEGFIFVYQDVRGRNMSEGDFAWMRPYKPKKTGQNETDETTDTWDTIEWLIKNIPNNNGRVGMWGISYPGHYSAQALIDPHPALKAVSPQAPMADNWLGDDMHHNGAFFLPHAFNFIINFGRPRTGPGIAQFSRFDHGTNDGYKFFLDMGALPNAQKYMKNEIKLWDEWMEHGDYDEYWQAQNVPQHLKKVTPAVMTVGGWFDAEDVQGPLWIYREIEKNNPKAWNVLVEGPWCHGCWSRRDGSSLGGAKFESNTSAFYQENIEFPFFMHFLKDKGEMKLPEAYVFETGSNTWKTYESWPPKNVEARSLYLHANGKLSFDAPKESGTAFDEYISDPNKPVPFQNRIATGMNYEYMTDDQRFSANRTDVLVYQTDVLTEDLTISGELLADLYASTSGTDSDFIVKLIDVYPAKTQDPMDGYQMLLRGEPMRAKYRKSWSKPEALKPNEVTHIPFAMPDINHTFKKGHRIMIHIQSTWFPLVDRNPQKFLNIYQAKDSDFQKATQRIYRSGRFSTRVKVNVLK
ncbi:MAG: CocE/NonD family hydrolase [Blastocatellales bacterium]